MGEFKTTGIEMDIWQKDIKELGAVVGKGIAKGTRTIVKAAQKRIRGRRRKEQIVDRMFPRVVRQLSYNKGLKPRPSRGGRLTNDDYKREVRAKVSLEELIEFADKKRIPIRDIRDRIDEEKAEQEYQALLKDSDMSDEFKNVVRSIIDFKPLKNYRFEYHYQSELTQWLRSRFSNTQMESQRGSSRPDIVVNGIAIEVKGPTKEEDLVTIADKCMRYSKYFKRGIIFVLFNVRVNQYRYKEWSERIKDTHRHLAHIEIIRK